jgi:parallel beta-helix repeat protein
MNLSRGILSDGSSEGLCIVDCSIKGNSFGIDSNGDQATIRGNNILRNANGAIVNGSFSTVENNVSTGNSVNGINVSGDNSIVIGNMAAGNGFHGIIIAGSNIAVRNNTTTGNSMIGINNTGASNRIYQNFSNNNTTNFSVGVSPVNMPGGALAGNFNDFISNVSN